MSLTQQDLHVLSQLWMTHRRTDEIKILMPKRIKEAIGRYAEKGIPPGSFLEAVLANDLFRAVADADAHSYLALEAITRYISDTLPIEIYGSYPKVRDWIETHRQGVERG